ncbi:MAG: phosphoribosylanthranilate isomerase, partial [Bacteroidota bacterium]|nr:phosphoribosylanthranilate isomerase [Bacteroidota bacterium]
ISREIVSRVDKPVFLAGGLHPGNVQEAIGMVRPFGVDICSGVRTNGRLDHMKLVSFVEAVQSCFA